MIEPVAVQHIAMAAIIAGAIVFFGVTYAIFYALAMLGHNARFLGIAYGAYLSLFAATVVLAVIMQLTGWWLVLVAALLAGYFIAPRFIWRLSVAVHEADGSVDARGSRESAATKPTEIQPL